MKLLMKIAARTLTTARVLPEVCQNGRVYTLRHYAVSTSVPMEPNQTTVKPLSEMPLINVSVFDIVKLMLKGEMKRNHEQQYDVALKYGPIYRQKFGKYFDSVFVMDAMASEQIIRKLGQETSRLTVPQWEEYRKIRGEDVGILSS